jgi:hypothetical protein
MKKVHPIRVQGNSFSHSVEWFIGEAVKGVDGKPEEQAKDPANPELIDARAGLGKAVAGEEQEDERRPERGGYKRMDAIPERIT